MALSTGSKILATDVAPKGHASTATTYGIGTSSNYGHVMLSDSTSSSSAASEGIAASPKAVKAAYDLANGKQDKLGYTPVKSVNGVSADAAGSVSINTGIPANIFINGTDINSMVVNASGTTKTYTMAKNFWGTVQFETTFNSGNATLTFMVGNYTVSTYTTSGSVGYNSKSDNIFIPKGTVVKSTCSKTATHKITLEGVWL